MFKYILCPFFGYPCPITLTLFSAGFLPAAGMVIRSAIAWGGLGHLGPALFLCMANLKTLSEIVRFSKSSSFSEIFWFSEFSEFFRILDFRKLPDFQNYLVLQISFRGFEFCLISLSLQFSFRGPQEYFDCGW